MRTSGDCEATYQRQPRHHAAALILALIAGAGVVTDVPPRAIRCSKRRADRPRTQFTQCGRRDPGDLRSVRRPARGAGQPEASDDGGQTYNPAEDDQRDAGQNVRPPRQEDCLEAGRTSKCCADQFLFPRNPSRAAPRRPRPANRRLSVRTTPDAATVFSTAIREAHAADDLEVPVATTSHAQDRLINRARFRFEPMQSPRSLSV
jgi:hypothetical protein